MPEILVIADDFTGAAEMGGIAHLFGISATIVTELSEPTVYPEDVVILDTNSRRLDPASAMGKVKAMLKYLNRSDFKLIYKKVDSVLRGPVESEIKAIKTFTGADLAVLIPANPSRGRIIRKGMYFIDDIPIDQTDFHNDPEYPRNDARVDRLISDASEIQTMAKFDPSEVKNNIIVPDVYLPVHFTEIIDNLSGKNFIPAGGADFFRALLEQKLKLFKSGDYSYHYPPGKTHIILGSICEQSKHIITQMINQGYTCFALPEEALKKQTVYVKWVSQINDALYDGGKIIIARPDKKIFDQEAIMNITSLISKATLELLDYCTPEDELLIEGGETASTVFRYMGNTTFRVKEVITDGIVKLALDHPVICITVKPGSYKWPERFLFNRANN